MECAEQSFQALAFIFDSIQCIITAHGLYFECLLGGTLRAQIGDHAFKRMCVPANCFGLSCCNGRFEVDKRFWISFCEELYNLCQQFIVTA